MRRTITAFLLSALVFPGLGQLYNQDRRKGVFLVLAANALLGVLFLLGLILISREYTPVFLPPAPHRGHGPEPVAGYPRPTLCSGCPAACSWPCGATPRWTRPAGPVRRPRTSRDKNVEQPLRLFTGGTGFQPVCLTKPVACATKPLQGFKSEKII